jgi:transcriptional regulator GlxA family with amidase domain
MVRQTPGAFESPQAIATTARKLEQLALDVIGGPPAPATQPGRHLLARRQIVGAAMDYIDSRDGDYLTVPDLAAAAGVSERTLRDAFQAYFGMGPVQYLRVRTLNLARRALQSSDPALTTVTDVATQFGVWELGRFAHRYKLLFGELPSDTLRHRH